MTPWPHRTRGPPEHQGAVFATAPRGGVVRSENDDEPNRSHPQAVRGARGAQEVVHHELPTLRPKVETACYRIVQEALANSARHAGARRAWVQLRRQDDELQLSIYDDGVVSSEQLTEGVGLLGIRERAKLLGERWRNEQVQCTTTSADGGMGVVGTIAHHYDRGAGTRNYGGYAHVVDLKEPRELVKLTVHEIGQRASGENGTSGVIACGFLGAWRHLVLASGNRIACFDVERGRETCSLPLPGGPDKGTLVLLNAGNDRFVEFKPEKGASSYFRVGVGR